MRRERRRQLAAYFGRHAVQLIGRMPHASDVQADVAGLRHTRLILDALRVGQTPDAWQAGFASSGAAWDDLVVSAILVGLAPQLHQRFSTWGLALPEPAAAKLAATRQAHALRNAAVYAQLGEVQIACQARGVAPILLKGLHLAALVFPDRALRPMNDLDLLVTQAELPELEALLISLGYHGRFRSPELGAGVTKHTSTFRRVEEDPRMVNPFLFAGADRTIEPHTSLEESWFGLRVDITPGVRERARTARIDDQMCRVLASEDLVLHLCVHLCFHLIMGRSVLIQLADLMAVLDREPVEWSTVVNRAIETGAAPFVLAALRLCQHLLDGPVPVFVVESLAAATPDRVRARVEELDLAYVLRRTTLAPLVGQWQRVRRGIEERAETARWASGWRDRWQVWLTALRVGRTDTMRMWLGRGCEPGGSVDP